MRFEPSAEKSSQIHCKHTAYNTDESSAAVDRILTRAQKQDAQDYLAMALPWCEDIPQNKRSLCQWILTQLAEANPGAHQKAISQQAIDLLLASTILPNVNTTQDKAQNYNWRWDRKTKPRCPEAWTSSLISDSGRYEQLSDTTRLLMAEWPLGSDPHSYQYEDPYRESFKHADNVSKMSVSSSQPVKEVTRATRKRPKVYDLPSQPISHRQTPSSSQADDRPSSSQALDFAPAIAQTQAEPGRFGAREKYQPAKRKKRTSGF